MNIAALGTAISFAKFIFLPHAGDVNKGVNKDKLSVSGPVAGPVTGPEIGFWLSMAVLLGGLVMANVFYYEAYSIKNVVKPVVTIGLGWLAYLLIFQKISVKVPRAAEQFDHLLGSMSLMLVLLFWLVLA